MSAIVLPESLAIKHANDLPIPGELADLCDRKTTALLIYDMQVGIRSQIAGGDRIVNSATPIVSRSDLPSRMIGSSPPCCIGQRTGQLKRDQFNPTTKAKRMISTRVGKREAHSRGNRAGSGAPDPDAAWRGHGGLGGAASYFLSSRSELASTSTSTTS